jgi:ADP-dependent NAD(P)H-hydrate dehydratase / NAD(P)H-hydrate epimerase
VRPVLTVAEMKAIDAEATEPVEALIGRAGTAVARAALAMMGGGYGHRVVVVAGKGNNGADGRAAAARLRRRGVRVTVLDAGADLWRLPPSDLVIDAAYGTGFRGNYTSPDPGGAPVLAVDIPSGVSGDTGECSPSAVVADRTVTFAALKPGLLFGEGPARAGVVEVADIGLDVRRRHINLVEDADVASALPRRRRDAHKWQTAVCAVAGSPGMLGAARLVSVAALRAGSGYVRLCVPGAAIAALPASEAVGVDLPAEHWDVEALNALDRCRALAVGPGLGRSETTVAAVRRLVAGAPVPAVVDADALFAIGGRDELTRVASSRQEPTVVTPHDGEFARLAGDKPGADRIGAARDLARDSLAVVLLKGSTTVIAAPDGEVLLAAAGSPRLATAGTGDVLSGVIAAFLAQGLPALQAAALAAHVHGAAAGRGHAIGLVAGDLPDLVAGWLSELAGRG